MDSTSTGKIGINGFGRIGRLVFRAAFEKGTPIVAINEPFMKLDYLVYNLKHDSVHGKFEHEIKADKDSITIGDKRITIFSEKDPSKIPWGSVGASIICECSGVFLTSEAAEVHLKGGIH